MSSTNKTPNYGLPQYIDTDKPTYLGDFNDAMGIIDKGMNDNKNAAGEGSNKMDEANSRIGDAEESLTETQNQVDSISGLAETIEAKVQTALTQANDAATKSGQANTNSTAAVNAANQASTDANAALQQAQGNVSQINGLDARVKVLEDEPQIKQVTVSYNIGAWYPNKESNQATTNHFDMAYQAGYRVARIGLLFTNFIVNAQYGTQIVLGTKTSLPDANAYVAYNSNNRPALNEVIWIEIPEKNYNLPVIFIFHTLPSSGDYVTGNVTYQFEKYIPTT